MRKRSRYKFRISISREGYENLDAAKTCCGKLKEAKAIGHHRIAFKEFDVTVSEFLEYAIKGYAFCHLFQFDVNNEYKFETSKPTWNGEKEFEAFPIYKKGVNKGYFKVQFKSDKFFHSAQAVFLDMEIRNDARKTKYQSIDECVSLLKKKPTCAFYSYSDKIKEDIASRRFQLVYVFDSILNKDELGTMTYKIYHMIEEDTREVLVGLSVRSSGFLIGGNNPHVYNSSIIYSVNDFNDDTDIAEYLSILNQKPKASNDPTEIRFTEELVRDMQNLLSPIVEQKWMDKGLEYILSTPIDFNGEDYKIVNDDYIDLTYSIDNSKDGQHRRQKLYVRAALRRLIKPNITADELLYNLFIDRNRYFYNSNGELSIRVLQNVTEAALRTEIAVIKDMHTKYKSKQPTFVINPNVTNKRMAVAAARRDITNRYIARMFDVNALFNDNLARMNQRGHKIGKSRLYQWCKDNNITPNKKPVIDGYNPHLSIRGNMAALRCTKHQVEKAQKAHEESLEK